MHSMKRLLLAVDDSDQSARAVSVARELATAGVLEVLVLHIRDKQICCKGPAWEKPMECTPDELVADIVSSFREAGIEVRAEIHPSLNHQEAGEILATANAFGADMIVAGWRPRSSLPGLLEKSTGQKISERSSKPLLLVP
jgi:nucleotide-binding universal stress UspA family protein